MELATSPPIVESGSTTKHSSGVASIACDGRHTWCSDRTDKDGNWEGALIASGILDAIERLQAKAPEGESMH